MRLIWTGFFVAFLTLVAGPAYAHPIPQAYSPEDGASIASPPSEAWVEFDQTLQDGDLQVIDPCGQRVDDGNAQILATRITVAVYADRAGTYTAQWVAMGTDPHKVSGNWSFTVTGGDPCPGSEPEDPKGGSGGSEDPSSKDTDVSASGGSNSENDNDVTAAVGGKGDKGGKKNDKHHDHGNKKGTDDPPLVDDGTAGSDTGARTPPSGDIPLDWLLISFGIAALIGAAAGQIYVNLVGTQTQTKPRRNN